MRGYALSFVIFVVVTIASTFGLRLLEEVYGLAGEAFQLHQLGPLIGAIAAALLVSASSMPNGPSPVARKQWIAHTILGVAAALVFALIVWAGLTLFGVPGVDLSRTGAGTVIVALLGGLAGAVVQEIGWRGYLQPLLESRMPRIGAAVIVGMLWSLWHVSALTDLLTGLLLFATYVPLGILLGHLGNGAAWQRVATTALVHWLLTMPVMFMAGIGGVQVQIAVAIAAVVVTAVFMAMFVVATKRRTARAAEISTS